MKILSNRFQLGLALMTWTCLLITSNSALAQLTSGGFVTNPEFTNVIDTIQRRVSRPEVPLENARVTPTPDGSIGFISAPPDHHFLADGGRFNSPGEAAQDFVGRTRTLLGVRSAAVAFTVAATQNRGRGGSLVRLEQTYRSIPIFGAQIKVQVNSDSGIEALVSDLARNTDALDSGILSTTPRIPADQAVENLRALLVRETGGKPVKVSAPELMLYDPGVLGREGPMNLAWRMTASSEDGLTLDEEILMNAVNGEILNRISNQHPALEREIYDSANSNSNPGTLVRTEGQAATGIADVDNAYQFYASAYNFYLNTHDRDSYDNGGALLSISCRFCNTNFPSGGCAFLPQNGMWSSSSKRMFFGPGVVVDDVVGHELTHGVTDEESNLIYQDASGAINESFSDLWGEFIDLTNGVGTDTAEVRWLMGEDWVTGGIRDMADPPAEGDPDRLNSPLYQPPSDTSDNGGVHVNSGVNNKLCFLLTDGGNFNGQLISGLGITRIAKLYYEVQTGLLPEAADWTDLYNALAQAAINLDWTVAERNNLYRACLAVEIAAPNSLWVKRFVVCPVPNGESDCIPPIPFFFPGGAGPFPTINQANNAAIPGDTLKVLAGSYPETLVVNKRLRWQTIGGSVVIGE